MLMVWSQWRSQNSLEKICMYLRGAVVSTACRLRRGHACLYDS